MSFAEKDSKGNVISDSKADINFSNIDTNGKKTIANLANDTNTQDSIRKDYNDAQLAYKQELEAI